MMANPATASRDWAARASFSVWMANGRVSWLSS
jgi:hypothetical protein